MTQQALVGYCRSSTSKQTIGLELQRRTINAYVERIGAKIIAWYEEARRASPVAANFDRYQPELARAIEHCRGEGATLIVARLDRMTRSAALLTTLLEAGPPLVVAEIPHAGPFVLQVYAAVAEEARRVYSRRCKAGIQAALARGVDRQEQARKAGLAHRQLAKAHALRIVSEIETLRRCGLKSQEDVAAALNARGLLSHHRRRWTKGTVAHVWRWRHRSWTSKQYPCQKPSGGSDAVAAARGRLEALRPVVTAYRSTGARTIAEIVACFNQDCVKSASGRPWTYGMVRDVLQKLVSS